MKNLNEQIERINRLFDYKVGVVISEQSSSGCNYVNYQNGDGIKKPKITVTKSPNGVDLIYEGPETGFCIQHSKGSTGDSIHQLAGVARVVVSQYLKDLYTQGTFVYPDLKNIDMVKKNKFFSIKIPFVKTTENKAITNFNERGGWGHSGKDSFNEFLTTISDSTKYGLVNTETKVASGGNSPDITENWVSFRDLEKYPIMTSSEDKDKSEDKNVKDIGSRLIMTLPSNASEINKQFKQKFIDYVDGDIEDGYKFKFRDLKVIPSDNDVKFMLDIFKTKKDDNSYLKFTIVFNPIGEPTKSKDNVLSKNPGSGLVKSGEITLGTTKLEYHIIGLNQL